MARFSFGAGLADYTMVAGDVVAVGALTGQNVVAVGGIPVTFWNAESGGSQHTDLVDVDGNPATVIVSSDGTTRALGQIPPFAGPEGVTTMWAQAGEDGFRALMATTDAADTNVDIGTMWPPLSVLGAISAGVGSHRLYNDHPVTVVIGAVRASLGTPGSSDTVVDINRNGTSIYSVQAERPRLAAGQNTSGRLVPNAQVQLQPNDWITVDIDAAGTGARDLVVQLMMMRS